MKMHWKNKYMYTCVFLKELHNLSKSCVAF